MKKLLLLVSLLITQGSIAQVVINEVMHKPGPNTSTNQGLRRKEYVEIYNKGCSPVDIGCWVVGSAGMGIQTVNNPAYIGGFQFPSGTIIAPGQHLVIGGTQSQDNTGYAASDIDYNVANYLNSNTCDPNTNWLLPNTDGWIALYDDTGNPIDAVYWSLSSTAPNLATDDDYASNPCVPTACGGIATLKSARQIIASTPSVIAFAGSATSNDMTFSRVPDGGAWQRNVAPSIAGANQCNNGQCSTAPTFQNPLTLVQPNCGSSDGSITIAPTPTGTYTYSWVPNVSSSASASNLAAGSYTIYITSAAGCQKDTTVTLSGGNGPTAILVNPVNASCGQSNGTVSLGAVTGGTAPYTYNLNNAGYSATLSYSSLAAGNYSLSVKDANGCTYTAPAVVIGDTPGPTAIVSTPVNASCGQNNGSVTLGAVTGGTSPYQYNFNNGGYGSSTSYTSLAAGSYSLLVKDANGCILTAASVAISNSPGPTAIVVNPVNASCGLSNGSVALGNVTDGLAPYQYDFNNGGYSSNVTYSNLAAGNYSLSVKDANGCIYTAPSITLTSTAGPTAVSVTPTNPLCGQSNGAVSVGAVTGGTSPYQYNFNSLGYSNVTSYPNLAAGTYTLDVRDAVGCVYSAPGITLNPSNGPTAVAVTPTNPTCGLANGSVLLGSVTGGTAPYQFNFNGAGLSGITSFNNLNSGTYSLIVQDGAGCSYVAPGIVLAASSSPSAVQVSSTLSSCGQSDASVTIGAVSGGTAPYQFNFNLLGYAATTTYTGLAPGNYSLEVKDAAGCTYTAPAVVVSSTNAPTAIQVIVNNATCGNPNGSVSLGVVTGGTSPYQYNFNNGGYATTVNYNGLTDSVYTLEVRDAVGCIYSAPSVTITTTPPVTAIAVTTTPTICYQSNGTIISGTITGGTAPYLFSLNGSVPSSNSSYNGLPVGLYTLEVSDANQCTYSTSVTIVNDSTISKPSSVFTTITPISCMADNATIKLDSVAGGTSPYLFSFNGGALSTVTTFTGLTSGYYPISIVDSNKCKLDTILIIAEGRDESAIYVPSAFTPNNDGINETWYFRTVCAKEVKGYIYNRWGVMMTEINDFNFSWDGKHRNEEQPIDVYAYVITITLESNEKISKSGTISLIR